MTAEPASAVPTEPFAGGRLTPIAMLRGVRVLAWSNETLYVSRGYTVERAVVRGDHIDWQPVGCWDAPLWRRLTSKFRLSHRLFRDGFHALAVLPSGSLVGAVAGAIVTLAPGESSFRVAHEITRGTRPLHIAATPEGRLFWGEYFDNPERSAVHIYASEDRGATWHIAHTFAKGEIRHVHNVVYDGWQNCLWILTGDYGAECKILRVSCDLRKLDVVLSGNQQARAVALVPMEDGLYFSSDTPLEANHVYRLDRNGSLTTVAGLTSSSIYGCQVGRAVFFSTMVEPSAVNRDPHVRLVSNVNRGDWRSLLAWKKDMWSMRLFQYGNAFLPDGRNTTPYLAFTTVAVEGADLTTTILRIA